MIRSVLQVLLTLSVLCGLARPALPADFHVAPDGSPKGDGSHKSPWDLGTALSKTDVVKPGDTVWLGAGAYRGGFVSTLAGTRESPVTIRGERGVRVTIDATPRDERDNALFVLRGSDAVYRDFEVTCSDRKRATETAGSWPADIRRGNVDIRGDRISAINLVVHDCGSGFGFWSEGEGGEISGCVIYYNGWKGPDRGHGHAIYAQNARGTKRIRDNIVFHQFGYGIHVYGSEKASLKGFDIDGNIAFDNGCLSREGDNAPGIMVGGASPAERIAVRDNVILGGGIRLGYPWGTTSEDVVCTGNYCEGLVVRDFRRGTIEKNTIVAHSNVVQIEGAAALLRTGLKWDANDYYVTDGRWGECAVIEHSKSRGMNFAEWQKTTGFDAKSTLKRGTPSRLQVIVRRNAHEPGRAHVAILNPDSRPEVEIDLSLVLKAGQKYRIVSPKHFYGPPLATGEYDGKGVKVATNPVKPVPPVGMPDAKLPATEPRFVPLVVLPD